MVFGRYRFALSIIVAMGIVATTTHAQARALTFEEKVSDLNQVVSMIKSGYGPILYKQSALGIDVDTLKDAYLPKVRATKSNGEFYYLIRQFVAEFKDSHFSASIPTPRIASLPFTTDWVDGKVVVDTVDTGRIDSDLTKDGKGQTPLSRGDQIISMNSQPISLLLDELSKYVGHGSSEATRRTAALLVSYRPGRVLPVPQGKVVLQFKNAGSNEIKEMTVKWTVEGEAVDEEKRSREATLDLDYDRISIRKTWNEILGKNIERSFRCSGNTRINIPKDATVIMSKPFVAYYHPTEKGNVGYLRIPHYYPENERTGEVEYELRFKQYEYAISVLEKNTVGLIIDQDHNCGGSVEYLNRMIGLFMDRNYAPLQFTFLANKREYLQFKSWTDSTDLNTLEWHQRKTTLDLIHSSWLAGEFMTPKVALLGQPELRPNSVHYTKPVVMLIDELSGSGGDAFPAMMQGFGRAQLLGTRTMGAGGHVQDQAPLFYSQIQIRMTKSLFYRPDGVPVENNGAIPDVEYPMTHQDFVSEYGDYQAFYLRQLMNLL